MHRKLMDVADVAKRVEVFEAGRQRSQHAELCCQAAQDGIAVLDPVQAVQPQ
jgi:hypothetical protein